MKKLYVLFLLITSFFANAQEDAFITTWEISAVGNDFTITVPLVVGESTNYTVDFGDGTILSNQSVAVSHTYESAGTYTITISGDFNRVKVLPEDSGQIRTIQQWGDAVWISMESAFADCYGLIIPATDVPDLSQVFDMSYMFHNVQMMNDPLNDWDVSNVTNMKGLFKHAISFNQPLDNWDVSSVTNMDEMFYEAVEFGESLNSWDVSNVTTMQSMFYFTQNFGGPLDNWDVSNVTNMREMFFWSSFNTPINNWDVSNVTNMEVMFALADFNQALDEWDVSNVTNMGGMFTAAEYFNQPIDSWNVSNVTIMTGMFEAAEDFNQPLNSWNVSSVTDMKGMFHEAEKFNQPLDGWDVSSVTDMSLMFSDAYDFNQPIGSWNVSNVISMHRMLDGASAFNQPLNEWNVSNVANMDSMFSDATVFNQPIDNWDVSNVLDMSNMFHKASAFNQDISSWSFNDEIVFDVSTTNNFLSHSGLDINNYDSLLLRFAQLGLNDKKIRATGIKYCDSALRDYLINELEWEIIGDSQGEGCVGNNLSGSIILDANNNGCDIADSPINSLILQVNNETFNYSVSASDDGQFELGVPQGTYNVGFLNLPDYITVNPNPAEITFEGFGNEETLNFCLTANETVNDLNITLLPLEEARPGFETDYQLVVQNMGMQTVAAATVSLTFDDTLQSFVSADPVPASATANTLTFDVANIQPFESRVINLTTELFTPPTVNGGEVSAFTATVTPNDDDYTPADNTFVLEQEVVNSYDPNDKRVLQGERIYIEQADEYLNYIIRFQNTGTASAITVRIEDLLHENLDWTTFTPLSASHDYRVEITEGNQVEFIFENINLPYEAANAEGSNGFIAYKIKPVADIQVGDVMEGNASIFFDYNLPIITNVATTEVIAPIEVTLTQTEASCNGESDGSASVEVEGGSGEYTYEWSDDAGTEATAEGLAAGAYTVTITDSYGDSITIPVTITQPGAMAVTAQPENTATATGGDAAFSVTASNVEDYQWQVSTDGDNWNDIENGGTAPTYSGAGTANLGITNIPFGHDGYAYRVQLENGDECISYSDMAVLDVANSISAVNDDFSGQTIIEGTGGTAGDVTLNDMFNGVAVDDTAVTISITDNDGLTGVAIDQDGNVMVPAAAVQGSYTIGYSICDALDAENCSTATAVIAVSAVSGTEDFSIADIVVYPNPASTEVYIRIPESAGNSGLTVTVHDINGRKLTEKPVSGELERIDISGFASGTYFFTIASDIGKLSKRIVKM